MEKKSKWLQRERREETEGDLSGTGLVVCNTKGREGGGGLPARTCQLGEERDGGGPLHVSHWGFLSLKNLSPCSEAYSWHLRITINSLVLETKILGLKIRFEIKE